MEYNQLALQLYQMGFFRPEAAEEALRCLELMDFKNKDALIRVIAEGARERSESAALRQRLMQLSQIVDTMKGTHLTEALAREQAAQESSGGGSPVKLLPSAVKSSTATERMREMSRQAVHPR